MYITLTELQIIAMPGFIYRIISYQSIELSLNLEINLLKNNCNLLALIILDHCEELINAFVVMLYMTVLLHLCSINLQSQDNRLFPSNLFLYMSIQAYVKITCNCCRLDLEALSSLPVSMSARYFKCWMGVFLLCEVIA